jgi:glycosyltransferase involved in cell wall biosynthesis
MSTHPPASRKLVILGTRGIPAQHGGFETFAEKLAPFLVQRGWDVTVYCQETGSGPDTFSTWEGVRRVHISVSRGGALGSVIFDWQAARHAMREDGLILLLGYNTAVFNILQRLRGQRCVINMDGIEWKRGKWGLIAKIWFYLNERAGSLVGNHLIADHPSIRDHLARNAPMSKITVIPYGGERVENANSSLLQNLGLVPGGFSVVIARPEPENSFREIVAAFSRKPRDHKLVVLGRFEESNAYHQQVKAAAGPEVQFPGAIYDADVVGALRFFSAYYLHGHTVGGTNPSLVEAMGAGCAVIAHDNRFNRWVAGPGAAYFDGEDACAARFDELLSKESANRTMREASIARWREHFTWPDVLGAYESTLAEWLPPARG